MQKLCPILTAARDVSVCVLIAHQEREEVTGQWDAVPVACQATKCMWFVEANPDLGIDEGYCGACASPMASLSIGPDDLLKPDADPFLDCDEDEPFEPPLKDPGLRLESDDENPD